jgi:hypothetical protein
MLRSLTHGPVPEKELAPAYLAEALNRGLVQRG